MNSILLPTTTTASARSEHIGQPHPANKVKALLLLNNVVTIQLGFQGGAGSNSLTTPLAGRVSVKEVVSVRRKVDLQPPPRWGINE